MTLRASSSDSFQDTVCDAQIKRGSAAKINGKELPVLKKEIKSILFFGDTGCRIKTSVLGSAIQNCNDAREWPLAKMAKAMANIKADLIIHVGDYNYRESACPAGDSRCAGSGSGDNQQTWEQDFFIPTQAALESTPWIFVRGNHEDCARMGKGWSRYLSAKTDLNCVTTEQMFNFKFGSHQIFNIDSSDEQSIPKSVASLPASSDLQEWVVTHRPFLSLDNTINKEIKSDTNTATRLKLTHGIFVGHMHYFAVTTFPDFKSVEFILGTGGSALDDPNKVPTPTNPVVKNFKYGFTQLIARENNVWDVKVYNQDGEITNSCVWDENKATTSCEKR